VSRRGDSGTAPEAGFGRRGDPLWRDARGLIARSEIEGQLRAVVARVQTHRLAPGLQVRRPFPHQHGIVVILPKPGVACGAKQATHPVQDMAVIDCKPPFAGLALADRADAALARQHALIVGDGQPIVGFEALRPRTHPVLLAKLRITLDLLLVLLTVYLAISTTAFLCTVAEFLVVRIVLPIGCERLFPVVRVLRVTLPLQVVFTLPPLFFVAHCAASHCRALRPSGPRQACDRPPPARGVSRTRTDEAGHCCRSARVGGRQAGERA
jgi:hypothetical protein